MEKSVRKFIEDGLVGGEYYNVDVNQNFKNNIIEGFKKLAENDKIAGHVLMNPIRYTHLYKYFKNDYEVEVQYIKIKEGIRGVICCADIIVDKLIPDNRVFILSEIENGSFFVFVLDIPENFEFIVPVTLEEINNRLKKIENHLFNKEF